MGYHGEGWIMKVTLKDEKRRAQCSDHAAAAAPSCPSATLPLPLPLPCNFDSRFDLHIFVNIYLHTCMSVHICYGIFAIFIRVCKYLQRLQGGRKVGRCSPLHMSKATDVKC